MEKRMREMMTSSVSTKIFGHLSDLFNGEEFLDAIDKEDKSVNVVIFIYEDGAPGCEPMHKGLEKVAKDYPVTKFCRVRASSLPKLSRDFKLSGVPALLVYRAGEMVTNFVGMTQSLGDDFFASDIESFLVEHAVIADKELVPSIVRGPANTNDDDSDSD
jgi:thioredoxin-like negative regulator of GroEL